MLSPTSIILKRRKKKSTHTKKHYSFSIYSYSKLDIFRFFTPPKRHCFITHHLHAQCFLPHMRERERGKHYLLAPLSLSFFFFGNVSSLCWSLIVNDSTFHLNECRMSHSCCLTSKLTRLTSCF